MSEIEVPSEPKILCVEDNEQNKQAISKALDEALSGGYQLDCFDDFSQTSELLNDANHDIILVNPRTLNQSKESNNTLKLLRTSFPLLFISDSESPDSFEEETLDPQERLLSWICKTQMSPALLRNSIYSSIYRHNLELDRSDLQQQLIQSKKQDTFGEITSGIAHDLNNKLTIIGNAAELTERALQKRKPPEPHISKIKMAVKSAASLCKKIMAFGKKEEFEPVEVNLGDAVRNSLELIEGSLKSKIFIDYENHNHVEKVMVDLVHLDQMLMNFVINASHALYEGGVILVRVDEDEVISPTTIESGTLTPGKYVVLSVIDNGSGIKPELIKMIFNPYFTTKSKKQGTGLGLSIVLNLIQKNNGYLSVTSMDGEGTEFRVYFPVTH